MHQITNRVLLRERMALRQMDDVDDLMGIFSDPVAMRYYPNTKSRQEAEEWVRRVHESYRDNGFGLWVAILEDSGEFAGQSGLTVQEVGGKIEIGYLFLRRFWAVVSRQKRPGRQEITASTRSAASAWSP